MRIAVLSDIHGNCVALDAVLADLHQDAVDQLVCLGDTVQGGAQPVETVARLRGLDCLFVMGNADDWLLTGKNTSDHETITERQEVTRQWSLAHLSAADRTFIAEFRPTIEVPLQGGRSLLCFHGSPTSFDDLIFPESAQEQVARLLEPFTPAILTGGHTHLQQLRRVGTTCFFNPGSVGLSYDRHPSDERARPHAWAEYAVLSSESDRVAVEFRRVSYDVEALREVVRSSGHPYAAALAAEYGTPAEEI